MFRFTRLAPSPSKDCKSAGRLTKEQQTCDRDDQKNDRADLRAMARATGHRRSAGSPQVVDDDEEALAIKRSTLVPPWDNGRGPVRFTHVSYSPYNSLRLTRLGSENRRLVESTRLTIEGGSGNGGACRHSRHFETHQLVASAARSAPHSSHRKNEMSRLRNSAE
jgi:hypothetical protein